MKRKIDSVVVLYEELGFKRGSFHIALGTEKSEVQGEMIGSWGVHKLGGDWKVTHIPTGMAACRVASLAQGKAFIEAMVQKEPSLLNVATEAEIMKHRSTMLDLIRNKPVVDKSSRRTSASHNNIDVASVLQREGLRSLGTRYGKSGQMFGLLGSARQIAVGKREIMRNSFQATIDDEYTFKKPRTSWTMRDSEFISRVDEKKLLSWIKWAKEGRSTKEVLAAVRAKYNELPVSQEHAYAVEIG